MRSCRRKLSIFSGSPSKFLLQLGKRARRREKWCQTLVIQIFAAGRLKSDSRVSIKHSQQWSSLTAKLHVGEASRLSKLAHPSSLSHHEQNSTDKCRVGNHSGGGFKFLFLRRHRAYGDESDSFMSLALECCARKIVFYVRERFESCLRRNLLAIRLRRTNGALRNAFLKSEAFSRMFSLSSGARRPESAQQA